MFPYYDIIRWVIDNTTITNRTFMTVGGMMFGYFRAEDIKAMYHLPNPQKIYNRAFIADFTSRMKLSQTQLNNGDELQKSISMRL